MAWIWPLQRTVSASRLDYHGCTHGCRRRGWVRDSCAIDSPYAQTPVAGTGAAHLLAPTTARAHSSSGHATPISRTHKGLRAEGKGWCDGLAAVHQPPSPRPGAGGGLFVASRGTESGLGAGEHHNWGGCMISRKSQRIHTFRDFIVGSEFPSAK